LGGNIGLLALYVLGFIAIPTIVSISEDALNTVPSGYRHGALALGANPWQTIDQRFPMGSVVSGPITNITDFGLFVEVEEGIEGLIHISEQSRDKQKMAALKVGDVIRAKVIHSSPDERRIGLSIRKMEADEEQSHYRDYMHSRTEATTNIGDLIRETLEEKQGKNND